MGKIREGEIAMRYLLIKRCRVVGMTEKTLDILCANNRIVAIEKNIDRPTIETEEIDVNGCVAIPGLVDICSTFATTDSNENLRRLINDDVQAGYTTWLSPCPTGILSDKLKMLELQDPQTLNYGLHFSMDAFKPGDINKIRSLNISLGIPSLFYTFHTPQSAFNEHFELYVETAQKLGLMIFVNVVRDCNADEHLRAFNLLCSKINGTGCKVFFNNIRYSEELDIVVRMKQGGCDVTGQIYYNPFRDRSATDLHELSSVEFVETLRQNTWLCGEVADVSVSEKDSIYVGQGMPYSRSHRVALLATLSKDALLTIDEMVTYLTTRKCEFMGLKNVKGVIRVGADADITFIGESPEQTVVVRSASGEYYNVGQKNTIRCVVMGGRMIYNGEVKYNNISGKMTYRRFV